MLLASKINLDLKVQVDEIGSIVNKIQRLRKN